MKLTLSFDNGPFPDVTPQVLDTLAAYGVRTTFFVCGKDAQDERRRSILARARREGHRIGNHTLSHRVELGATDDPDAPRQEIGLAQAALGDLAGEERLFRPYGGGGVIGPRLLSKLAVEYLCAGGYTCVLWNSVPRDWEDPSGWPERALLDIARRPWSLLVLHDVPTGAMRELPRFLARVRAAGVEIVPEFPTECVPIARGCVVGPLDAFVATE